MPPRSQPHLLHARATPRFLHPALLLRQAFTTSTTTSKQRVFATKQAPTPTYARQSQRLTLAMTNMSTCVMTSSGRSRHPSLLKPWTKQLCCLARNYAVGQCPLRPNLQCHPLCLRRQWAVHRLHRPRHLLRRLQVREATLRGC